MSEWQNGLHVEMLGFKNKKMENGADAKIRAFKVCGGLW